MRITDPQGRQLAAESGLLTDYAKTIPGASLVEVEGVQVAALTTGGPFLDHNAHSPPTGNAAIVLL